MFKPTDNMVTLVLLVGLLIRVIVALINSFVGPTLGADQDASFFHGVASDFSISDFNIETHRLNELVGVGPYAQFLGYFYRYFFNSLFFGCILSILAWLLTAIIVLRSLKLLDFDTSTRFFAILFFALIPSSIFYTSVTLREPFQLLFLTLLVFSMMKFYIDRSALHFFLIPVWAISLASLHNALIPIAMLCVFFFIIFVSLAGLRNIFNKVRFYSVVCVCLSLIPLSIYVFNAFGDYSSLTDKGIVYAILAYQEGLLSDGAGARAFYRTNSIGEDLGFFVLFLPTAFIQYQLEPFPWNIGTAGDLIFFLENCIRSSLIVLSAVYFFKNKKDISKNVYFSLLFIFFIFLIVESIWSLGTLNWGTASRHHIPALGLLAIVSAPTLANSKFFLYDSKSSLKSYSKV